MDSIFQLAVMFSVIDQATGPVKNFMKTTADMEKTLKRSQGMIDMGNKMAVSGALIQGAATQMRSSVQSIVEPVITTNDALVNLSTVTTSTFKDIDKSMNMTRNAAVDWEKTYKDSAETFINTSYMMASAGLNDIQTIAGTQTALAVATATFGDHSSAANLIATSYNNMGDKSRDVQKEMARLGDILTVTQQTFQFSDLNQLSEGLKYGTPAAIQARIEFAELNTVIGQLNNAGLQGSMAGTAFSASIRQMNKASQELGFNIARTVDGGMDFIGTLKNIEAKYGDISRASPNVQMAFQKAFGEEGLRTITLLNSKTQDMQKNLKKVQYSYGATSKTQSIIEGSDSNEWQNILNNIRSLKREAGESLMPTIRELIPTVRTMIQGFAGFVNAHPGITKTVVILFALSAAVLSIVAPILTVIAMFIMMTGYTLGGAAHIALFFKGAGDNTKRFTSVLKKLPALLKILGQGGLRFIRPLLGIFLRFGRFIPTIFTMLQGLGPVLAGLAGGPVLWIVGGVILLGAAIYSLYKNWDIVKAAADSALDFLGNKVTAVVSWLDEKRKAFWESGRGLISAFGDGIKSLINQPVALVTSGLQKVRNLLPFSDAKEGPLSTLNKSGRAFIETWRAGIQSGLPGLQDMLWSGMEDTPMALAGAGVVPQSKVNLSEYFTGRSGRPIIIQKLVLQVEKVDSESQLISILTKMADEVSDED